MSYSTILDPKVLDAALKLCKGTYQQNLLLGKESLSGATLRGTAKQYSGRYKSSVRNLMERLQSNGLPVREEVGPHNKRIIVIG